MNRNKFLLFLSFCLVFSISIWAQEATITSTPRTFTLLDAQIFAIKNSYAVRSSMIDLSLAEKKIWETTAMGLPQISAKISYQNIFNVPQLALGGDSTQIFKVFDNQGNATINQGSDLNQFYHWVNNPKIPLGVQQNTTIDLTISQLVFSGEYIVGLRASRIFREFAEQGLKKTQLDTKLSVTKTYYLVLVVQESVSILDSSFRLISKTATEIEGLNKQGFVEETDVDQMHITVAGIKNTLENVKRQLEVTKRLLKFQMGISLDEEISLSENLETLVNQANIDMLSMNMFDSRSTIEYQLAETGEQLTKLSLDRTKSKFLPTVAAFYRHEEMMDEPAFNFQPPDVLGVSIDIPIFSSFMRVSQVKQAALELEKSKLQKIQAQQGLELEFRQTRTEYETALDKYQTLKESYRLSKKIYDKTLIKYREGVSSSTELTTIQNQYLTTQSNYYTAIYDLLSAKAKMEKLLTTKLEVK